jgi:hypothetical protein
MSRPQTQRLSRFLYPRFIGDFSLIRTPARADYGVIWSMHSPLFTPQTRSVGEGMSVRVWLYSCIYLLGDSHKAYGSIRCRVFRL